MKNKLIILLLLALVVNSCKRDSLVNKSNYLIFGHFYGECIGEKCIEIFKLEDKKLFEDSKDEYPQSQTFYKGRFVELSQQKFNDTKELMDFFPKELLNETNSVIGSPDAADGGGLYIEYNFNGTHHFWLIDQMKNNVPLKYHAFMDKVNEKINALQ